MKYIDREQLSSLKSVLGTPDIKIITGVRRSGKSTLLNLFEEYIATTIRDAAIIHIDFTKLEFESLREYHALNQYIEARYQPGKSNFLLIDEVQMCPNFEYVINSLHSTHQYDIYITGSNAFLLGSDLATLFTGRTYPIEVYPFSFKEYLSYYGQSQADDFTRYTMLDSYLTDGGFAGSYIYNDTFEKYRYLESVYDTMIIRDIKDKYSLTSDTTLSCVGDFLMDNISRLTNANNIANVLTSAGTNANNKTISNYLDYFCRAFAFHKVKRYDIEGKNYLRSQDKYYLCDHSLKFAKLGTKNVNYGSIYENIVAMELIRRGYEIYVGTMRNAEVDFVATRRDEKFYIQVSYDISTEDTFTREVAPLLNIRDAYPKFVIARTRQPEFTHQGIRVLDLADFLCLDKIV